MTIFNDMNGRVSREPAPGKRYHRGATPLPFLVNVKSLHMKDPELYWIEARSAELAALQAARFAGVEKEDVESVRQFKFNGANR
ncbi:MAG: hypothetical protein ABI963_03150 [Rhizomicrobium sp.]